MARGSDLERELPFGFVRQLFEPGLADAQARSGLLSGSAAAADRVFEPQGDGAGSGDASFAVLYGLFWLTANLGGGAASGARNRRPALVRSERRCGSSCTSCTD